jgi:hypothetical protein
MRATLLRLAAQEHVVLFTMHHIVADAWSMNLLIGEVAALYESFSLLRPSPLPELAIQYADYAVWQRQWLQGEVLEQQLQYWKHQLSGKLSHLDLPTDRPRPPVPSYLGESVEILLPPGLSRSIAELSRREGVTLFMTLLAAFKTLLYRYTNQEDIIVGSAIAGRNRAATEPLIGFFINMLVMRSEVKGHLGFRQLLAQVRETALGAYAHQDVPFEKLVEELRVERSGDNPIFQVAFGLQNTPRQQTFKSEVDLVLAPFPIEYETVRYDVTLWMAEAPGGLGAAWKFRSDLFDASTIRRMHGHFETLLADIVARPDAPLDSLAMQTESEKQQQAADRKKRVEQNYRKLTAVKPKPIRSKPVS